MSSEYKDILERLSTNKIRIDEILVVVQQIKDKHDRDARQQNLPALVNPVFQINEDNVEASTNNGKFFFDVNVLVKC